MNTTQIKREIMLMLAKERDRTAATTMHMKNISEIIESKELFWKNESVWSDKRQQPNGNHVYYVRGWRVAFSGAENEEVDKKSVSVRHTKEFLV